MGCAYSFFLRGVPEVIAAASVRALSRRLRRHDNHENYDRLGNCTSDKSRRKKLKRSSNSSRSNDSSGSNNSSENLDFHSFVSVEDITRFHLFVRQRKVRIFNFRRLITVQVSVKQLNVGASQLRFSRPGVVKIEMFLAAVNPFPLLFPQKVSEPEKNIFGSA